MNADHPTPLARELIDDTSLWRLILRIDPRRLSALLIGPESVERPVVFHSEPLPDESVKALENAIYDNPLLLSDFAATDVIFSTSDLFLAPEGTEAIAEQMAAAMLPDYDAPRRVADEAFAGGRVVFAVNSDLFNFASRTFAAARFHHALAINARYLRHRNDAAGMGANTYALCEAPGEMSLVAFDSRGRLSHLSRPEPLTAADCAYFTLAGPGAAAPMMVGGEPSRRNAVCDVLRAMQPDARVLPLTLPEDLLRLRRMAPDAAFDMLFITQL